ncbi:MAG: type I DNA topoisomerase [Campylobacterales bacterium]
MKGLVIVESPTKARTIKSFLDSGYEVIATKGHVMDLPKRAFGITIEDGSFTPKYTLDEDHKALVDEIKKKAKKASQIYIATDEDREGEAIGYFLAQNISDKPLELPRVVFHEVTKSAILKSIENPRNLDINMINAQQARRLLDRIVGYKLSPLISSKIQKGLSAGRVQSAALKIVVDREKEIQAFKPVTYYSIVGSFKKELESELVEFRNKKIQKLTIGKKEEADEIKKTLESEKFAISTIEKKSKKVSPSPPFTTSTLQQSASSQLGFSPKRTMMIAQSLYEGVKTPEGVSGVITYMRTDSLNIAESAIKEARSTIDEQFGKEFLPKSPRRYKSKSKGAQEAHEAIRPTKLDFTPEVAAKYLKSEELRLYRLIYNRFLASQMTEAQYELLNVFIASESGKFKLNGRRLVKPGFYKLLGADDKDKILPELQEGKEMELEKITSTEHQTEPPPRFSEAALIKTLESLGIGRPSTYAPTISILESREYIEIEKRQIRPEEIAFKVIEVLQEHFGEIVDSSFTAKLEEELDEVAEDKKDWQKLLSEFYEPFMKKIESGKENIKSQKMAIPTGENCPKCGAELVRRKGRFGEFIACSGFPKCKYTAQTKEDAEVAEGQKCEKCGKDMVVKSGKRGKFLACSGYPECKNTKALDGSTMEPKEVEKASVPCPECGGDLLLRKSRRGAFYGCSNYPKCKFISKFEPVDKKCSECGYLMAKRELRKKPIYECIKCKNREDREE